jgi:nitric oxide dioxygenase
MIEYPKEGILSKDIINDTKLNVTLFCMAKEAYISDHTSTKQGTVYVIEGNGNFNLKGKSITMLPGTLIHMEKNVIHNIKAKKNTSFLLTLF